MNEPHSHRIGRTLAGAACLLAALAVIFLGCGTHPPDDPIPNLPPHIRLTGGPPEGGRTHFKARIQWMGWDDDGRIDHYEYATDPPGVFTAEEIESPETSPATTVTTVPSRFTDTPDTLRIGKILDGISYTFDYIPTREPHHTFEFVASINDTVVNEQNQRIPYYTASDFHTVHVRAQDDRGAYSHTARLGLNAWTYAPTSWIAFPNVRQEVLNTGLRLVVQWSGNDPDPPGNSRPNPVGYYIKLVDLRALSPPLSVLNAYDPEQIVYQRAKDIPWIYRSADTTEVELYPNPGEYLFAVRAVDAMGAVEPFVAWRRDEEPPGNAFLFLATERGGLPSLTVKEPNLGTFNFRGNDLAEEVEVPAGTPLRFTWSASAEEYGGRIEAFSWGLDIADLEQDAGWSNWGLKQSISTPIQINTAGTHLLYVRARDSIGSITTGILVLRVYEFTLDRDILFVDDFLDSVRPRDSEHDQFWRDMIRNSGRFADEPGWFETGGLEDRGFRSPSAPAASLMARYKLIVWNTHGAGLCLRTGLFHAVISTSRLRLYLAAGGQLWLDGKQSLVPTLQGTDCPDASSPLYDGLTPPEPAGDAEYPHAYEPGDFAWDLLKIRSDLVDNDKAQSWFNDMVRVEAVNREDPILPDMTVDPDKLSAVVWSLRGIPHVDAIFGPILVNGIGGFRGRLDSLYTYVAAGPEREPGNPKTVSRYNGRIGALRWHDPDPDRLQGRVMWFGFPMYYMFNDQAQETFNRAIDWFREEKPKTPAP